MSKKYFSEDNLKCKRYKNDDQRITAIKDSIRRDLGNRLVELRKVRGLTQIQMIQQYAETTPTAISTYSRWETGTCEPDICFLVQLHEKWGIDLNELLAGDDAYQPQLPEEVRQAIKVLEDYKHFCIFGK